MLALSKAVQYKEVLPKSLNIRQLTHECIQHFARKQTYNAEAIKEAVQYLDSRSMKIRYLNDAGLIEDVMKIYVQSEDYNSAYELVLRHGKGFK